MGIGSGSEVSSGGENAIFRVLKQRLKPPYCIFDVGSNRGQFLRLILDNVAAVDFNIHCLSPAVKHSKLWQNLFRKIRGLG